MDTARLTLGLCRLQGDPRDTTPGAKGWSDPELSSPHAVPRWWAGGWHVPDLLSSLYVPGAEEGDPGEAQVLVGHEHPHRDEVGLAQVVDEAADVAVETGIDAVNLSVLGRNGAALVRARWAWELLD